MQNTKLGTDVANTTKVTMDNYDFVDTLEFSYLVTCVATLE